MNQSRLVSEEKVYVKFDDDGNTEFVKGLDLLPGFSYRRVHYTREDQQRTSFLSGTQVFRDPEYTIDQSELDSLEPHGNQRIVLRRLYDVYKQCPKSMRPQFFPPKGYIPPRKLSSDPYLPPFSTEIGVFPVQYYKTFFITQSFSKSGMYEIIINNKGRFQTDVVDDWVPVRQHSLQPIWGMEMDNCWQIILLKFWAKRNGGYRRIMTIPPFYFLQFFSNSNWKYYNLSHDGYDFLTFYTGRTEKGKFVLKTKNTQAVQQAGLIPNSAGYELINLVETTNGASNKPNASIINGAFTNDNFKNISAKDRHWVATVRSTMINKWSGTMSVLDKQINNRYYPQQYTMALDRDFMLNQADLLNLFSTAYIASRRDQKQQRYFSDYYILKVEPNIKRSIYLKFTIPKDGWLDFCIKQLDDNRVQPTMQSRVKADQYSRNDGFSDGLRYLKCRYILVKQNTTTSPSTFTQPDYLPPAYDTYEIEFSQGYNRGDARFLKVVQGTYILKIKPQAVGRDSHFVVNYACDSPIEMREYFPTKKQTSLIMRQSMASLIGLVTSYHLDITKKHQQITFANVFQQIGYGFVGVRSKKSCPYRILIDVDPAQVKSSGYKLKNQFKNITTPFSIFVSPGECTSVVLKKIPGTNHVWPPNGIEIFKEKTNII